MKIHEKFDRYVRKHFNNLRSDQIEDMVQDGAVKYYTAKVETEGGRAISALNAIHDAAKRERTQTKRAVREDCHYDILTGLGVTYSPDDPTPPLEYAPARQSDPQRILEAKETLFSLPLSYQRVIMAKYIGHDNHSGAKALNMTPSCFRSLLSRAQRYARRNHARV